MKKRMMTCALLAAALTAAAPARAEEAKPLEYKKTGFYLGGELAGLVGFADGDVFGAPGKVDLLVGYQVNPYFSVGADLWTFWFIAYAAEAQVKANFTDSKISPYAVGTIGVAAILTTLDEDDGDIGSVLTYSAGLGVDFHLWKKATLFTEVKYRGGKGWDEGPSSHGIEAGVGFRWVF